ncbi:MAG: TonB family protein [Pseudomonadota bacterium]
MKRRQPVFVLISGVFWIALVGTAHSVDLTAQRRALVTPTPDYPNKAIDRRLEGDVRVCYIVDMHGRIHRPRVEETTDRIFNRAALRAARGLRYEAAEPGATNRRTHLCSTFRFRLNRGRSPTD